MSSEELAEAVKAGRKELLEDLWLQVERFVRKEANRWTHLAEADDLCQEGYLILASAVEHYERREESSFLAFYKVNLKWGWIRYINSSGSAIRLPVWMSEKIQKYEKIRSEYVTLNGHEPSQHYMEYRMQNDSAEIERMLKAAERNKIRSLNEELGEDGDSQLLDFVADPHDQIEDTTEQLFNLELRSALDEALDQLRPQEARSIRGKFFEMRTLQDMAVSEGVSAEMIRQRQEKALRLLKRKADAKKNRLLSFIEQTTNYYIRTAFHRHHISSTEYLAERQLQQQEDFERWYARHTQFIREMKSFTEQKAEEKTS